MKKPELNPNTVVMSMCLSAFNEEKDMNFF